MSIQSQKERAIIILLILIVIVAAVLAWLIWIYMPVGGIRFLALFVLSAVLIYYLNFEIKHLADYYKTSDITPHPVISQEASLLVLLAEDASQVKSWDISNRVGLVIGRSHEDAVVDIDLSGTEYFSLISNEHAVLNFIDKGWLLTDVGSKNGTSLIRDGSENKLLLTPGEPVPIKPGDIILLAEETRLAIR
ncbi:MAG: FHA domain-containing protein [Peptococcaceae bacterium]|nr:FHA domain-containing protein [Peptococcaceae bacterium]